MHTLLNASLFFAYAVLNTFAMAVLKSAMQIWSGGGARTAALYLLGGSVVYAAALGTLLALLRDGEASMVFPIAIGCTIVATNAAGARFYGERISGKKLLGTALIFGGIAMTYAGGA